MAHHYYVHNDTLRYNDTTRVSEYYRNDTLVIHEQHTIYRDRVTEVGKTDTIVKWIKEEVQHTSSPSPLYLIIIITLMAIIIVALAYILIKKKSK